MDSVDEKFSDCVCSELKPIFLGKYLSSSSQVCSGVCDPTIVYPLKPQSIFGCHPFYISFMNTVERLSILLHNGLDSA